MMKYGKITIHTKFQILKNLNYVSKILVVMILYLQNISVSRRNFVKVNNQEYGYTNIPLYSNTVSFHI
ncbi:MAG: hypothetical protein V8R51_00845 [Clostridia bacterium]